MILSLLGMASLVRAAVNFGLRALWCDEWASVILARYEWSELITRAAADIHPPLYFLLLHLSIRLFGENDWAFRLPSLLASVAALPFIYAAAKRLVGREAARITLALTGASSFLIHLSGEVRHHGLPVLLTAMLVSAYFGALRRPTRRRVYLLMASAPLLVLTHHFGWFALTAVAVHYGLGLLRRDEAYRRLLWAAAAAAGLCLPSAALLVFHLSNGEAFTDPVSTPRILLTVLKQSAVVYWHILTGPTFFMNYTQLVIGYLTHSPLFWLYASVYVSAAALSLLGWVRLAGDDRARGIFFAALVLYPVALTALTNPIRLETRYFAFLAPFLWMLIASGLARLAGPRRRAWIAAALAVQLAGIVHLWRLPTDAYHHSDYIGLSRFVSERAGGRDAVVGDMQDQYLYYVRTLGLKHDAAYFKNAWDLDRKNALAYETVYYLGGFWEEDGASDLIIEHFRALGFERRLPQRVFGDGPFVSMLNIFSRVSQS